MYKSINKISTKKIPSIGKYVQSQIGMKIYNKMNVVNVMYNIVKKYSIKNFGEYCLRNSTI